MRELALFAGAGGGLLASRLLGWRTVCAVEVDEYCRSVLRQRQLDGCLDPFPIWDDVRTFDGRPWRGAVDVVSGGFPCQDISSAGRGAGLDGDRSGLWFEMLRIIGEVRPAFVFAENSPNLRTRGLDRVITGLAELGFECAWGVLGAWHVGAPHRRNRMWIVASHSDRRWQREQPEHAEVGRASTARAAVGDADCEWLRCAQHESPKRACDTGDAAHADGDSLWEQPGRSDGSHRPEAQQPRAARWWSVDCVAGVDDGLSHRLERVRATGNGQVPAVAALAWEILSGCLR